MSMKRAVAAYLAAALVTAPPAAAAAVRLGSSAREKVWRSSSAATPAPTQLPASVKATAETARQPARPT